MAAGEGLELRFDIARSGLTFDAHRIVHLAGEHGLQDAMKERLLSAYFTEGELVADHETLVRLAVEVGLAEDEVSETLAGDRYAEQVREDERTAGELGITAVPTFVVDRTLEYPVPSLPTSSWSCCAGDGPIAVRSRSSSPARRAASRAASDSH